MVIIRIVGGADGSPTPHDGKYVIAWDPHTEFGTLGLTSTDEVARATRFDPHQAVREWQTISRTQPTRRDGRPNRPLTGISIALEAAPE